MAESSHVKFLVVAVALVCGIVLAGLLRSLAFKGGRHQEPSVPKRVITMTPGLTECVYALGLDDKLVAVSQFSDWPPEAKEKNEIGGWLNPNFEKIQELKPDLLLIQGEHDKVRKFCSRWGIKYASFEFASIADILSDLERLAAIMGSPERGVQLSAQIRAGLADVKESVAGGGRTRVFLVTGREKGSLRSLGTTGKGTFLTELIDIAGGSNIFGDIENNYPRVSVESVIQRAPEVIIEVSYGRESGGESRNAIEDWKAMDVPAVKSGRVYRLHDDYVLKPGPRIVKTARLLAKLIHGQTKREPRDER